MDCRIPRIRSKLAKLPYPAQGSHSAGAERLHVAFWPAVARSARHAAGFSLPEGEEAPLLFRSAWPTGRGRCRMRARSWVRGFLSARSSRPADLLERLLKLGYLAV